METGANCKTELRPLFCRLDAYTRCDGSALLSQGIFDPIKYILFSIFHEEIFFQYTN